MMFCKNSRIKSNKKYSYLYEKFKLLDSYNFIIKEKPLET